jgi:hypothetical protein
VEEKAKSKINLAIPNGIILGLIGLLVLLTPWAVEVPENQLYIDYIAGIILFLGGLISLILGLRGN